MSTLLADLLNTRWLAIARLVADGYSNREIAEMEGSSVFAIKTCLTKIYERMGVGGVSSCGSGKEARILLAIRYDREFNRTYCVVRAYNSGQKKRVLSCASRREAVKHAGELRWVQRNWSKRRSYSYRVEKVPISPARKSSPARKARRYA